MNLLEALVALAILGLSAVSWLEVFQASARSTRSAESWHHATAVADAAIEEIVLANEEGEPPGAAPAPDGLVSSVSVEPWRGRVSDVVVTVRLPDGRTLTVHRLVRRR